jgi:hypothetical protein
LSTTIFRGTTFLVIFVLSNYLNARRCKNYLRLQVMIKQFLNKTIQMKTIITIGARVATGDTILGRVWYG